MISSSKEAAAQHNPRRDVSVGCWDSYEALIVCCLLFLLSGPTPLHLAVRCGSLDAVACLLANNANTMLTDEQGWAAIHHAAYYDQERILRMLIRRNAVMTELQTKNEYVHNTLPANRLNIMCFRRLRIA